MLSNYFHLGAFGARKTFENLFLCISAQVQHFSLDLPCSRITFAAVSVFSFWLPVPFHNVL